MKMNKNMKRFAMLIFSVMLMLSFTATAFAFSDENAKTETQVQTAKPPVLSGSEPKTGETTTTEQLNPLTPNGNATLVDDATEKDKKQFLTVVTPNDNYFYIVIDHQKDADNVYMLSAIDENDLMKFVSDGKKVATPDKTIEKTDQTTINETKNESGNGNNGAITSTKEVASSQSSDNRMNGLYLVIVIVAAAAIGYYVFRMRKNRSKDEVKDEDLEFYDDETYINEDDDQSEGI